MADDRIQQRINDNIADIPIFYGQPDKDTITLKYYVSRIDQGVSALNWTQGNAYVAFKNYLKGAAANWLASHVYTAAQQLEIKGFVDAGFHAVHDDFIKEFILGGLPEDIKTKVANKPNLDTVLQIVDFLINEQNICEKKKNGLLSEMKPAPQNPPAAGSIHSVAPQEAAFTPEEALAAIQFQNSFRGQSRGRGNRGGARGRGGPSRGQHSFPGAAGGASQRGGAQQGSQRGGNTGGGAIQKDAFCIYCHKKFHKQEECRSRIRDNAPCYSPSGTAYFPKVINSAEEAEQQENVDSVNFDYETNTVFHETA